jgi:hypothetical protein
MTQLALIHHYSFPTREEAEWHKLKLAMVLTSKNRGKNTMPRGILWAVLQQSIAVPAIHPLGKPHHITLFYDVEKIQYQHLIDTEFEATAIANLWNKDIQAIAIWMPDDVPHKPRPHITVSYCEGVEPVASNELMKCDDDRVIAPFTQKLKFKIEFFEFPECDHHWLRNGKRGGLQQWICKHCKNIKLTASFKSLPANVLRTSDKSSAIKSRA